MGVQFDPYAEWLQVPADRRPPTHYDLLGLPPLTTDDALIRLRGSERIALVRRYHLGAHAEDAMRLLGELSEAFACLTDSVGKQQYDQKLRASAGFSTLEDSATETHLPVSTPLDGPADMAGTAEPPIQMVAATPGETSDEAKPVVAAAIIAAEPGRSASGATPGRRQTEVTAVWALDVGHASLKALRLRLDTRNHHIAATDCVLIDYPPPPTRPDADLENRIQQALDTFAVRHLQRGERVVVSLPGSAGVIKTISVPASDQERLAMSVRFEARLQLPFPLDESDWAFQCLPGQDANHPNGRLRVGLFAARKYRLRRMLAPLARAGLEADFVQLAPVSLYNMLLYDRRQHFPLDRPYNPAKPAPATLLVSCGAESCELLVTNGYHLWHRVLPLGGNHLTVSLAEQHGLSFDQAERFKKSATGRQQQAAELALRPVIESMAGEIRRAVGQYKVANPQTEIARAYMVGGVARQTGFGPALCGALRLEVRSFDRFEQLADTSLDGQSGYSARRGDFATCFGLGLQGLGEAVIRTNLLPPQSRRVQRRRRQRRWMPALISTVAAAVCLLAYAFWPRDASTEPAADATTAAAAADDAWSPESGLEEEIEDTSADTDLDTADGPPTATPDSSTTPTAGTPENSPADSETNPGTTTTAGETSNDVPMSDDAAKPPDNPATPPITTGGRPAGGKPGKGGGRKGRPRGSPKPNQAPSIAKIDITPQNALEGEPVSLQVAATDPDDDTPLEVQFRTPSHDDWQSARGSSFQLIGLPAGETRVLVRSVDPSGLASADFACSIVVEANPWRGWKSLDTLSLHTGEITGVDFRSEITVASSSKDGTARIWRVSDGLPIHELPSNIGAVSHVAYSSSGNLLFTVNEAGSADQWNAANGKPMLRMTPYPQVNQNMFFGGFGFGNLVGQPPVAGGAAGESVVAMGRDAKFWATANARQSGPRVSLWRPDNNNRLQGVGSLTSNSNVTSLAFTRSAKVLAVGGEDGSIRLWSIAKNEQLHTFAGHAADPLCLAFSLDERTLASGDAAGNLRLWDVDKGELIWEQESGTSSVRCLAFGPGTSDILASGGDDRTVHLWRVSDGRRMRSLAGHRDTVTCLSFSGKASMLASGSEDTTIRLWGENRR